MSERLAIVLIAVLVAVGLVLSAPPATACECVQQSEEEYLAEADAVFEGTVIRQRERPESAIVESTFDVDERVKGEVADPQTVASDNSASCGYDFQTGGRYRVYAKEDPEQGYSTSLCWGTRPA